MANGVAYGFEHLQDIFNERIRNLQDITLIDTAVTVTAAWHSAQWNAIMGEMVERTTKFKERFRLPTGGELQPLSQDGVPVPTKQGASYDVAYPLMRGGDSFGGNREVDATITVAELNRRMLGVQTKDAKWLMRRTLAAAFTNASYVYNDDDDQVGSLTIKGLANNDSDTYNLLDGTLATANNYLNQAGAIADNANPYLTLYAQLYQFLSNQGPYVAFINPAETATTLALTDFEPFRGATPYVQYGITVNLAADEVGQYQSWGNRVLGTVNGQVIVVEARRMPAGYILMHALGAGPFIKMREDIPAELQGLQATSYLINGNFHKYDFYRKAGFGVMNRVAAAVLKVSAGSYSIPTDYDASLLKG